MLKLWTFKGGLHLDDHKPVDPPEAIELPIPSHLIIPLQQHIGEPTQPSVHIGDSVFKGQVIGYASHQISAHIHAPTSGIITDIKKHPVPHPSGLNQLCIIIKPDGKEQWDDKPKYDPDHLHLSVQEMLKRIIDAGITGFGGASFPTHIKLSPMSKSIDTLVINGAECEPYISCDDILMRSRPDAVLNGIKLIMRIIDAKNCLIGIEDNKIKAIEALGRHLNVSNETSIKIIPVPTQYPTGGEKQLIHVLTGITVPVNSIPANAGVICHNVSTAEAVFQAIAWKKPFISRIITIAGNAIHKSMNAIVPFGTPINEIIKFAGGYNQPQDTRLIMGGPMMGFSLNNDQIPVIKSTNCILALSKNKIPETTLPCIRCGACADVCPMSLLPQQLYWFAKAKDFDKIQNYNLFDCIECGCCAYVCPSKIPLIQYYRFAKTEIWGLEQDKKQSDKARIRHQKHDDRIKREKAEKAARHQHKKEMLQSSKTNTVNQNEIQAAIQREKQKQENK